LQNRHICVLIRNAGPPRFGSVDELDQIPGIGEKRLAALREKVRV
jgi:DNA uptake protein ComE-like DNA-binding protein